MSFVQIMEFDTKRAGEVESLMNNWRTQTKTTRTVKREVVARHHDRPNHYVAVVEFPSYEDAQRSNKLPETDQFNAQMAQLCEGPIEVSTYDVIRDKS
jgi:quinol monooxygenase YgiN